MVDTTLPREDPRKKPEDKDLPAFIALATTILQRYHPDDPVVNKTNTGEVFRVLQQITTLLTAGTPTKDPYASRVVAVTANVQRDAIYSLVFVSQNTNSSASPQKTELKSLEPEESMGGDEILKAWATRECVFIIPPFVLSLLAI